MPVGQPFAFARRVAIAECIPFSERFTVAERFAFTECLPITERVAFPRIEPEPIARRF